MNHALSCHLPTALALLFASVIGVKMLFPERDFTTQEMLLISVGALIISLSITGAFHV